MNRKTWLDLFRSVRTPEHGENLFPKDQRAEIALDIAKAERKEARKHGQIKAKD